MHVVYSETIKSAGLIVGNMYYSHYVGSPLIDVELPVDFVDQCILAAETFETAEIIDPLSGLNGSPVYILSGSDD